MSLADLTEPEAVKKAILEFDKIGRKQFLNSYGFGKSRDYFLIHNDNIYDSKAIVAVAYKYEHRGEEALTPYDFSGGDNTVAKKLRALGFTVNYRKSLPLVFVENEKSSWEDVTGELYHFPNKYINEVLEGRPFIYYRGAGEDKLQGYYGVGKVGEVYRDERISDSLPKGKWKWFCKIEEFVPFEHVVPHLLKGMPIEEIPPSKAKNYWRDGVREISPKIYKRILKRSDLPPSSWSHPEKEDGFNDDLKFGVGNEASDLLKSISKKGKGKSQNSGASSRRSKDSKIIGDWGEEYVYEHLKRTLSKAEKKTLEWVADEGRKPGWDIEYKNTKGELITVEVKGTRGTGFVSFELTVNEWNAAEKNGKNYHIYLVANCMTKMAKHQIIINPFKGYKEELFEVTAIQYRVEMFAD